MRCIDIGGNDIQHFLLSAKARTLTLGDIYEAGDDGAFDTFCSLRWPQSEGEPVCPECGVLDIYPMRARRRFRCAACGLQFSTTTGTILAGRNMKLVKMLAATLVFVNGTKGISALQLGRDVGLSYKSAFVFLHKLREVMMLQQVGRLLGADGIVEVDGAYIGKYVRPKNEEGLRMDRRKKANRSTRRRSMIGMRERGGKSIAFEAPSEVEAITRIRSHLAPGARVHADEGTAWDALHWAHEVKTVNHSFRFYDKGVCTNLVESGFNRLRRMEMGAYHSISGPYANAYGAELMWREDHRRVPNGEQVAMLLGTALATPTSRDWAKYWQRHEMAA